MLREQPPSVLHQVSLIECISGHLHRCCAFFAAKDVLAADDLVTQCCPICDPDEELKSNKYRTHIALYVLALSPSPACDILKLCTDNVVPSLTVLHAVWKSSISRSTLNQLITTTLLHCLVYHCQQRSNTRTWLKRTVHSSSQELKVVDCNTCVYSSTVWLLMGIRSMLKWLCQRHWTD